MTAWVRTSASEWPVQPAVVLDPHAAEDERPALGEPVAVPADAGRDAHAARSAPGAARAARTRASSRDAEVVEHLERLARSR